MIKKLICLLLILFTLGLFTGCSKVSDEDLRAAHAAYDMGAMVIDVRSKEEFKEGHIPGATNIDIAVLTKSFSKIPKRRELIVYCRSGSRSKVAAQFLRQEGWVVYDVATQDDWNRELPPVKPKKEG